MYLVKTIIQLHGGEISAESVEGEYTRLKFRLPKKKEVTKKRSSKEDKNIEKSADKVG